MQIWLDVHMQIWLDVHMQKQKERAIEAIKIVKI